MQHHTPPAPPPAAAVAPVQLNLDSANVSDLVRALAQATGRTRYAMAPEVVAMASRVTLALDGPPDQVWADGVEALALAGVAARCVKGLCRFSQLVVVPAEKPLPAQAVLSYAPHHRDVAFLAQSLAGMFTGWHFAGSGVSGSAAASGSVSAAVSPASGSGGGGASGGHAERIQAVSPTLIGMGPVADRARLMEVLRQLDTPVARMVVHLAVYEVDVSNTDNGALSLVGKVLGSSVQLGGSVAAALASAGTAGLTLSFGGFQAVVAALNSSSVAHLVTSPTLRTGSGVMASVAVGDSVPTLGSVSYTQGSSTPVQSIQYQQSGVVFSVVPELIGENVDVALYQSVSTFVPTAVGVTSSPTLQNRVLSSDLTVRPGAVVVLGGLMQSSETKGRTGWWVVPLTHNDQVARTELVLVLSVDVDG